VRRGLLVLGGLLVDYWLELRKREKYGLDIFDGGRMGLIFGELKLGGY